MAANVLKWLLMASLAFGMVRASSRSLRDTVARLSAGVSPGDGMQLSQGWQPHRSGYAGGAGGAGGGAAAAQLTRALALRADSAGGGSIDLSALAGGAAGGNHKQQIQGLLPGVVTPGASPYSAAQSNSSTPPETGSTSSNPELATALALHNKLRALHGAAPLSWSVQRQAAAQQHADSCSYQRSVSAWNGGQFGESVHWDAADFRSAIQQWYDEGRGYDYSSQRLVQGSLHFVQIVWKGTTSLGCGYAECAGSRLGRFFVCQYSPGAGSPGSFQDNVSPPIA